MTEKVILQIEIDQIATLPTVPMIQANGQCYIGTKLAGRRIKAVIFEDE